MSIGELARLLAETYLVVSELHCMLSRTYAKVRSAIACLDVYVHFCMLRGCFAEHVCVGVFVALDICAPTHIVEFPGIST